MEPTTLTWRDLAIGAGTDYRILSLEGWEEDPPSRYDKQPRARAHGAHPSPVWADERIVTVEGWCWSTTERDRLLARLRRATGLSVPGEQPLAIAAAGRTLTAGAQLIRAVPSLLRGQWGVGRFGWLLQWRCPDPLRYGTPVTLSTGLPTSGGGLTYPLTYPLNYGQLGDTGQLILDNPGTADAPILFAVTGALPEGYEISAAGDRLRYPVPVPAGQVLELDTATGTVLVEGTASRRGNLTDADWLTIPAGGSLTVQFTSLGGVYDPAARLTATWAETHW